jgi:hypothetical protein
MHRQSPPFSANEANGEDFLLKMRVNKIGLRLPAGGLQWSIPYVTVISVSLVFVNNFYFKSP